jgi:hypothetical protein
MNSRDEGGLASRRIAVDAVKKCGKEVVKKETSRRWTAA